MRDWNLEGGNDTFFYNRGALQSMLDGIGRRGISKHVNVNLKCTRGYVQEELIGLELAQPRNQLANIFTKRIRTPLLFRKVSRVSSFNRKNARSTLARYN